MYVFRVFISLAKYRLFISDSSCVYLEGSHAELDAEAQVNAEVVRQKIEEHVVSAKQRDEEEGGFGQASVAHNKETRFRS